MPQRKFDAGSGYRYGFNGKEKSDEVSGDGNIYDYGFRIYNPRIGKFLSVDPLTKNYPWYTPYQFAGNTPIQALDIDGREPFMFMNRVSQGHYGKTAQKVVNGSASGVEKSLRKTWHAVTHPWQTLKSLGAFVEEAAFDMSTVKVAPSPNLDAMAKDFKDNVINGDAYTRSEYFSELGTDALLAKGLSKAFTVTKGMVLAERISTRTNFVKAKWASAIEDYGMEHINWEKSVSEVKSSGNLINGKNVVQWREPGNPNASPFFTYEGVDPGTLGIPKTYTQKYKVEFIGEQTFLQTTANNVKAFSTKDPGVNGMYNGGGAQLYSPDAAKNATFTPAGN